MRIYKYSMRFRVPALDQSDCSICYNYDLIVIIHDPRKHNNMSIATIIDIVLLNNGENVHITTNS